MGQGIGEVLTFAIGVAISPLPVIAVILMLFSERAKANGPMFLLGWVVALAVVSTVVFVISDGSGASTSSTASDTVSWGRIVLGGLCLLLAVRQWRGRPTGGVEPEMPKWMAGLDSIKPGGAFGLGVLLAGVNPKNLILTAGAAAGVAQLGLSSADALVPLIVFVVLASLTIAAPIAYYLLGGEPARRALDELKEWLAVHNAAVMTVLFLVFGFALIGKSIPLLAS